MKRREGERGYIALMSVIIIGLILLTLVTTEGMSGWYARFNVLGSEAKEQSGALAEGCADQALSSLIVNPSYKGNATTSMQIDSTTGTCYISPVATSTLPNGHTLVTIKAQAEVRGAYANLQISKELQSIVIGAGPTSAPTARLTVITHVINDSTPPGIKTAPNFTVNVIAQNPSLSTFFGSEGGTQVSIGTGGFAVSQTLLAGYKISYSGQCSGAAVIGGDYVCTITEDDIPQPTLTVNLTLKNNDGTGTKFPWDFQMYIDGNPVAQGSPISLSAGTHTITGPSAATLASWHYAAGAWGTNCNPPGTGVITLVSGDVKTCSITYDDIPPAALACADTVIMMDRSGSVFSGTAPNRPIDKEAAAVKGFLGPTAFGNPAIPASYVGIGSMGGYPSGGPNISSSPSGHLTTSYGVDGTTGTVSKNISGTNLSLNYTGANVSWVTPTNVASPNNAFATAALSGNQKTRYLRNTNYGFSIPAGATINGIEVTVVRKASTAGHISDYQVSLLKNNAATTTSYATGSMWGSTTATSTPYGGPNDLWGTTWTPADINSANTGVIFAAQHDNTGSSYTASVDAMTMTVYYTIPGTGLFAAVNAISSSAGSGGSPIDQMINAGQAELAGFSSPRQKVLILITDGQPNSGATDESVLRAADAAKSAGTKIFTMFYGTDPSGFEGQELMAAVASGTSTVPTHTGHTGAAHQLGSLDNWANSTSGYAVENTDLDNFFIAPTADDMPAVFTALGAQVCPQAFGVDTSPAPATADINITTVVSGGTKTPADFQVTLNAINPSVASPFAGVVSPGTNVTVEPGAYSVSVVPISGYTTTYTGNCSGTVAGGDFLSCTITNTFSAPGGAPPPPTISTGSWVEVPN